MSACRIEVREPQAAAVIRVTVKTEEIGGVLAELLPEVARLLAERSVEPAGRPFTRYLSMGGGAETELEAGIPVREPVAGGRVEAVELPGGEVAVTLHVGPYDRLGEAHERMSRFLLEQRRAVAGAPWESYLTDPGEQPDPSRWETEVVYPLG